MKIPLEEMKLLGESRYVVSCSIQTSRIVTLNLLAILDTGSPFTIIMEKDLRRRRIPHIQFKQVKELVVGNTKINLIDLGSGNINFIDANGKRVTFQHKLLGGILASRNPVLIESMPSLIGKDFLTKHNLGLIPEKDRWYLKKF